MNNNTDFLIHKALNLSGFKCHRRDYWSGNSKRSPYDLIFKRGSLYLRVWQNNQVCRFGFSNKPSEFYSFTVLKKCLKMSEQELLFYNMSREPYDDFLAINYPELCKLLRYMK
jgi:hypothetical protein